MRAEGGSARNTRDDNVPPSAATINRDLVALGSFLTWCQDVKGIPLQRPKLRREREPQGRERWLAPEEIRTVEAECPKEWWALFATLLHTGVRIGEAQGLAWADVRLSARRITIHEGERRVKSASSVRDVPVSEPLAVILSEHSKHSRTGPADPVFPAPLNDYDKARDAWQKVCLRAGLHNGGEKPRPNATIHDLRHTFGVAAAQAGVPIERLQKLLGHTTAHMTMRYMKHAPEAYFKEDAARVASALAGASEATTATRRTLAKPLIRKA